MDAVAAACARCRVGQRTELCFARGSGCGPLLHGGIWTRVRASVRALEPGSQPALDGRNSLQLLLLLLLLVLVFMKVGMHDSLRRRFIAHRR